MDARQLMFEHERYISLTDLHRYFLTQLAEATEEDPARPVIKKLVRMFNPNSSAVELTK